MAIKIISFQDRVSTDWGDNTVDTFYYVWLKDNSPENRHTNGQKLTESREVDLKVKPKDMRVGQDSLIIEWGEKTIEYPKAYLKGMMSEPKGITRTLWSKLDQFKSFDYDRVVLDESELLQLLKHVKEYGFSHLINVPRKSGKILDVVSLFGYPKETNYGKFYDVIARNNPENLADTQLGLPPHTDNPYRNPTPGMQVLHCLKSDTTGGETILVDGFNVATNLMETQRDYFELLCNHAIDFKFENKAFLLKNRAPIIEVNAEGKIEKVKFNNRSVQPFKFENNNMLKYYEAYQYFESELQNATNQLRFKLEPSHLIIFDNERLLHGRTSYNLYGERHLQGCYVDKDVLNSKIAVLEKTYNTQ